MVAALAARREQSRGPVVGKIEQKELKDSFVSLKMIDWLCESNWLSALSKGNKAK